MNTTKKGDKLEDQAFVVFDKQIAEGYFFTRREYSKIFQKKGYYSRDREKDIIFDISVEVTLPGQERYSLLFLIECKNYNHRVPVDDIEEFFAKIQQVSGANVKGIVMSTNSFQQGAFNFAKSKGIGLLRYFKEEKIGYSHVRPLIWCLRLMPLLQVLALTKHFGKKTIKVDILIFMDS
ncbi:MAG: restriction endonuclease [Candidatus Electrothrix sp. AW5]|nr:restriction endonuclease [Candidatus Electrothrix gigas]